MNNKRKTIIQPEVFTEAEKIYEYIKLESPKNAKKFQEELLKQIDVVEAHPTANPPENLLNAKRTLYRFKIVTKSWKLIFKVKQHKLTSKIVVFINT